MANKKKFHSYRCKECGEENKLKKENIEGYSNWKCEKCMTIQPFLCPPKIVWKCSKPTPVRCTGKGKRIR